MRSISLTVLAGLFFAVPAWAEAPSAAAAQTVTVGKVTCKEMMAGSDMDRGAVVSFYHGYLAGKKSGEVIDITAMGALSDRVYDYCLSNPTSTVMGAFGKVSQ